MGGLVLRWFRACAVAFGLAWVLLVLVVVLVGWLGWWSVIPIAGTGWKLIEGRN